MTHGATKSVAAVSLLAMLSNPLAQAAAPSCFRPAEIEADQAIRYQTELMVLSDSCRRDTYRDFTVRNRDVIVSYDQQLLEHFRRAGAKNPEASLESFLTQLANQLSLDAGKEPLAEMCSRSAQFLDEAGRLDRDQFRQRASELATEHRSAYRRCTD